MNNIEFSSIHKYLLYRKTYDRQASFLSDTSNNVLFSIEKTILHFQSVYVRIRLSRGQAVFVCKMDARYVHDIR